jgi:hypothetical protein
MRKYNQYTILKEKPEGYDNLSEFMPNDPTYLSFWHDRHSNKIYKFNNELPAYWKENEVIDLNQLDTLYETSRKHNAPIETEDQIKLFKNNWETVADNYFNDIEKYNALTQKAYAAHDVIQKAYAAEGKIVPAQYFGIEVTNFLNQLRGVKEKGYVIQDAVQTLNVPYIEGRILKRTGSDLQKNLNTADEIKPVRDEFTHIAYEIRMHGTHIMRSEDIYLRPLALDPYQSSLNGIQQRVAKAKAELTLEFLDKWAGTPTTGVDWGALTGAEPTNRPFDKVLVAASRIYAADGEAEIMIMNDFAASYWNINKHNNGGGTTQPATSAQPGRAKVMQLKGLDYQVYVDPLWTRNDVLLMQRDAALSFQGPTRVATYDDVHHRSDGYYFWTYFGGKIIESDKIVRIDDVYTP